MYITSPETGRPVKIGSRTYKQLEVRYDNLDKLPRLIPVYRMSQKVAIPDQNEIWKKMGTNWSPWPESAPLTPRQRRLLRRDCGDGCFLLPESLGFPVCGHCDGRSCACKINCRALEDLQTRAAEAADQRLLEATARLYRNRCASKLPGSA
ncbi:MAG: hypothetical protein ACYCOU_01425 [Sulfobacillus sp.]